MARWCADSIYTTFYIELISDIYIVVCTGMFIDISMFIRSIFISVSAVDSDLSINTINGFTSKISFCVSLFVDDEDSSIKRIKRFTESRIRRCR